MKFYPVLITDCHISIRYTLDLKVENRVWYIVGHCYLYKGRAVTKVTNLKPDRFAIFFVKLIYFNVNTYVRQFNMLKGHCYYSFQALYQYMLFNAR